MFSARCSCELRTQIQCENRRAELIDKNPNAGPGAPPSFNGRPVLDGAQPRYQSKHYCRKRASRIRRATVACRNSRYFRKVGPGRRQPPENLQSLIGPQAGAIGIVIGEPAKQSSSLQSKANCGKITAPRPPTIADDGVSGTVPVASERVGIEEVVAVVPNATVLNVDPVNVRASGANGVAL